MGMKSQSGSTTTVGFVGTAGKELRNDELLEQLRILWLSYSKPSDGYRHALLARAIEELECCYATIKTMDRLIERMECENET